MDVAVNPNDTEESIWAFLCEAQLEGPEAARAKFLQVSPILNTLFNDQPSQTGGMCKHLQLQAVLLANSAFGGFPRSHVNATTPAQALRTGGSMQDGHCVEEPMHTYS